MGDRTATGSVCQATSVSRKALYLTTGLCTLFGAALLSAQALAQDLPTGAATQSGQITVTTPNPSSMTILQGSDRAVVNWNSFSIGQGAQVVIKQPNAGSALLNRVTGATTSDIRGRLTANGQVHLVNPNGIFIGPTGRIQTQGMVASTLDISDDDFNANRLRYSGNGASASVVNEGDIALRKGGFAALLGGRVTNSGTVTVPLGRIGLAAGERVTLDLTGDQFLQVALPSKDDGDDSALIQNDGRVSAEGGMIEMKAATARNAVRNAINLSGVAEARSVSVKGGTIYLGGGPGGSVKVSGTVSTKAPRATIVERSVRPVPRPGGDITITGARVALAGAQVDASGAGGGGTIRIGGDFAGQGVLPRSASVTADAQSDLRADGLGAADGGRIVLWSDLHTDVSATLSATGGEVGGDGGFVEISSAQNLRYRGTSDLRAAEGAWGALLLDPYNITVALSGGGLADPTVDVDTLVQALALGSVTLDTSAQSIGSEPGNITIDAPIAWTAETLLQLDADASINVNATITADAGSFQAQAAEQIILNAPFATQTGSVTLTAQDIILATPAPVSVASGDLVFSATRSLTADSEISATTGSLDLRVGGDSALAGLRNDSGQINVIVDGDLDLTGAIRTNGGAFYLETTGTITPTATASVDVGEFQLRDGTWDQVGGTIAPFRVESFWREAGTSFLRANGGDGSVGNPFIITDIHGLQGIDSPSVAGLNFRLGQTIDARETQGWFYPTLDASGFSALGGFLPFTGVLDGDGYAVEGLFTDTLEGVNDLPNGVFRNIGPGGVVRDMTLTGVRMEGEGGGLFADLNQGTIERVSITGTALLGGNGVAFGGFVAQNTGNIRDSLADVDVVLNGSGTGGGFVGTNASGGVVETSGSQGRITYTDTSGSGARSIGGFVGTNAGAIADSYAAVDLTVAHGSGSPSGDLFVGGFSGTNQGAIDRSLTFGSITDASPCCGAVTVGGFNAQNLSSGGVAVSNYWDTSFGLTAPSDSQGGTPLSQSQLQNASVFFNLADPVGWDFANTWAPGDAGHHPVPYALAPVILVQPDDVSVQYGLIQSQTTTGTVSGGPGQFAFGPQGDTLDTAPLFNTFVLAGTAVGSQPLSLGTTSLTSAAGQAYRVVEIPALATVTRAPLTIAALDQTKTYGTAIVPSLSDLTIGTLYNTDRVDAVGLTSAGFDVAAQVQGSPYAITPSGATGLGLSNYDISYVPGALTVAAAPLAITANDRTKPYGTALSLGNTAFSTTGLRLSDRVDAVSLTSAGRVANAQVQGSPYAITPSAATGSGLGNYAITYLPGALSITPAPLTITADDRSKVYGSALALGDAAFSTSGLIQGDSVARVSLTSAGADSAAPVAGAPYAITPSGAAGTGLGNYTIAYLPGTLSVTPALLTITADDQTKPYGSTLDLGTIAFSTTGLLLNDTVARVDLSSAGTVNTASIAGGPYAIDAANAVGTGLSNYAIAYQPGDLTVTPAPLTITADDRAKVYGTALTLGDSAFTATGLVLGDTVTGVDLASPGTAATAPVTAGPYAITPSAAAGTGLGNYVIDYVPGDLTITPAPLTITADDRSKTYGTAFDLGDTGFAPSGLLFSDTVATVDLSSPGALVSATVAGGPYGITPSAAQGTGLGNYAISYRPGQLDVAPAPLTITANDQTKTYGTTFNLGTTAFSAAGLVLGDMINGIDLTSAGADLAATVTGGPYVITASGAVGAGLDNYVIAYLPGTLSVIPAPLTIRADDQSKAYGTTLTLDQTAFQAIGLVTGDSVDTALLSSQGLEAAASVAAGPYAITAQNATGVGLSNYVITYADGALTVTPAPLTITAQDRSKVYGTALTLGTSGFTTQGLLRSDSVDRVTLDSAGAIETATVRVGPYDVTASNAVGSGLDNYAITYVPGDLTVNPAPLTVTAGDQDKVYGTALTLGTSGFASQGLLFNDRIDQVALTSAGSAPSATVAGGPYALQASAATGVGLGNYAITYLPGTLTVVPAPLTITALDQSKVYGTVLDLGTSAIATSGLVLNDSVDRVTLDSAGVQAGATVGAGPYAITATGASGTGLDNYVITYADGALTVTPAPLTISAQDQSKVYGTALNLGSGAFTAQGLRLSDSVDRVTLDSAGAVETANVRVGPYDIATSAAFGTGLDNYAITYLSGALTVTPAPLTVTASDQDKVYGTQLTPGQGGFTAQGLLFNDRIDQVALTSAGAAPAATVAGGPYALQASAATGRGLGNYDIRYLPGTLTVVPAPLTVTALDQTKLYGTALDLGATGFTTSGLVLNDTVTGVALNSVGAEAAATVLAGPYAITPSSASGTGLDNYAIAYTDGALTVTPAPLTITANDQGKVYGTALDLGTSAFTTRGLVLNDSVDQVILESAGAAQTATVAGAPYAITARDAQGRGLGNYTLSYVQGALGVAAAPLVIEAQNQRRTNQEQFAFAGTEFQVRGIVVPTDSVDGVDLQSQAVDTSLPSGAYDITVSNARGTGLSNYAITYQAGQFLVGRPKFVPPKNNDFKQPNPRDRFRFNDRETGFGGGGLIDDTSRARDTLSKLRRFAATLEARVEACAALADTDVSAYLSCLSDALAEFASSLESIANELPPGMENVARIVETARTQIDAARVRAEDRLSTATSEAERADIRTEAIAQAQGAVQVASDEIRKSIALVRVEDPELAQLHRAQIEETAAALDTVGIELSRVVGL